MAEKQKNSSSRCARQVQDGSHHGEENHGDSKFDGMQVENDCQL